MSNDNFTLAVRKTLISKLQPLVCCSESGLTCINNSFCSSDSSDWPGTNKAKSMVKLSYPKHDKETMVGTAEFCDAYIKWNMRTGCGSVQDKMVDLLSKTSPSCDDSFNSNAIQVQLHNVLFGKCPILYDGEGTRKKLNSRRIKDLQRISEFCLNVNNVKAAKTRWGDVIKGGGILSIVVAFVWLFRKLVRLFKGTKDYMEDASYITKGIGEAFNTLSASLKNLFTVSIPNFLNVLKYIVTFGWLRGKKLPEDKKNEIDSASKSIPTSSSNNSEVSKTMSTTSEHIEDMFNHHVPDPRVVYEQLSVLVQSENYRNEGENFLSLSENAKRYFSNLAVNDWNIEPSKKRRLYFEEDDRLTEGKLPREYLFKFAKRFLHNKVMLGILEESAKAWSIRKDGEESHSDVTLGIDAIKQFVPTLIDIKRQMSSEPKFLHSPSYLQNYTVKVVISEWMMLSDDEKEMFINTSKPISPGYLPDNFIRFVKKLRIKNTSNMKIKAEIYYIMTTYFKYMSGKPFYLQNKRVKQIFAAWNNLTPEIRDEFAKMTNDVGLTVPVSLVQYILKIFSMSTAARLPLHPSDDPAMDLQYHIQQSHMGMPLGGIMEMLIKLNSEFAFYPKVAEERARLVVDAWRLAPGQVQHKFFDMDKGRNIENETLIPASFIEFIYKINSGVGFVLRRGIDDEVHNEFGWEPQHSEIKAIEGRSQGGEETTVSNSANGSSLETIELGKTYCPTVESFKATLDAKQKLSYGGQKDKDIHDMPYPFGDPMEMGYMRYPYTAKSNMPMPPLSTVNGTNSFQTSGTILLNLVK